MSAGYTERQGVITANTTVYSEPTTSAAKLLVMKPGESLQAVEVRGGGWLTAFFSKGGNQVQGYFQASNLELYGQDWSHVEGAVIHGPMYGRTAPSSSAEIKETFRDGLPVKVAFFNANWVYYTVGTYTIDGKRPWLFSPRSQVLLYDPPHTNVFTRTAIADVYARAAPWSESSIVRTFASGTTLSMVYFNSDWAFASLTVNDEKRTVYFEMSKF